MVSIRVRLFCSTSLLLLAFTSFGQWTLSGKVVDAGSGEGLSYVNITFRDAPRHSTTSDQQGSFSIHGLTARSYPLVFSMIGYQSVLLDSVTTSDVPLHIIMHPEAYLTGEVVVSASRKSQSLNLAPASVGLITRSQLRQAGSATFEDAFNSMNGIQVTRSSGSNVQAFSIRGASEVAGGGIGNRVLMLLDGRPAITPESGGALWNLVPTGAIERVEVIKGAYSSLFGSSAMGGIVNVITRIPDSTSSTQAHVHYGRYDQAPAFTGYNLTGSYYGADLTHSHRQRKWSYVLNAATKINDGHRENSAFEMYNGYGKLKYEFSPNRSLQVSAMYNDIFNDTPATWLSTRQAYSVADFRKDDTQHRREWNADLHYVAFAHSRVKYSTRFYYYAALSDYVFNGDIANDSTNVNLGRQFIDTEKVIVNRLGHTTQVDFSAGDHHYFIGGIELQKDYIDGRPDTILYGVHHAWNAGIFIQDQITMGPRWTLTAGVRYDYYRITGTFMEGNINPKIAAVYQASKKISLRTLVARAYRNPSIAERYTRFEQGGGLRFSTSPLLRAEKLTLSAEVGAKLHLTRLKVDAALFYNQYKDLISYRQLPSPGGEFLFEVINLNKSIMQGFEISAEYQPFTQLQLQSGYTYLDAKDASDNRLNDVLPYKSKHTTYFNILLHHNKIHLMLQARSRSRIDEVFIYPGSEPDGYLLYNARLSVAMSSSFSMYFRVDNITDVQYEEIERYRMQGRSFTVGMNFDLNGK